MNTETIADLRKHLFAQLARLNDISQTIDIPRARMVVDTAQAIIDSARVEVQAAAILKGALTMPFIEGQSQERPNEPQESIAGTPILSEQEPSAPHLTRAERVLNAGPSDKHAWRGGSRTHRIGR